METKGTETNFVHQHNQEFDVSYKPETDTNKVLGTQEEMEAQLAGLVSKPKQEYVEMTDKDEAKQLAVIKNQGLRYNEGKLDYTLMDLSAFKPMIEVLAYGAHKYSLFVDDLGKQYKGADISVKDVTLYALTLKSSGRDNWKLGGPNMTITKLFGSLFRHIASFLGGENDDSESKLPHIGHIMCNVMFIGYHMQHHLKAKKQKQSSKFDDRFKS